MNEEARDRLHRRGHRPTNSSSDDIVEGSGSAAAAGDTVEVHYVGVDFSTGEQFDASWDRGESIVFPLSGLIAGWQEGIPGMKVGGRRQLVIPPELAYGPAGSGAPALRRHFGFRDRSSGCPLARR